MPPTRETVLDLEVRRRIAECVGANPGLHLRGLAEKLALPLSTLEYHCYQLEKHGQLVTRHDAGYKAFYPAKGMDRRDRDVLYLIRQEAPRRLCAHLIMNPNSTPKELRDVVGLSAPTLSFHLGKLRKAELIEEEKQGRTKLIRLRDVERMANLLVQYRASFVDDAVDRFAKAWMDMGAEAVRRDKEEKEEEDA